MTGAGEYLGGSSIIDPAVTAFDSQADFTRKMLGQAMSGLAMPVKEQEDYLKRLPHRGDVGDYKTFNAKMDAASKFFSGLIKNRLKYLATGKGEFVPAAPAAPKTAEEYLRMKRGEE